MRSILIAMAAVAGIGFVGVSYVAAAPVNGAVINHAADAVPLSEQVHCRWYPHRHRNNVPHGWGRGCGPRAPKHKI
jgi:hypothetical protein